MHRVGGGGVPESRKPPPRSGPGIHTNAREHALACGPK